MIYPLTICFDRYNGVYSGGLYTAWNCDPENVPTEISDDDVTCADFWRDVRNDHYTFLPTFGVGSTVDESIEDLRKKLTGVEEDHDKETRTSDIFCEGNLDMVPVVKVREALGIAEDSDIFECIEYRNRQLETLRDRLVVKRRMYDNAIDERNKFGRRLMDIREASGMADDDRSDLVEYIKALREKTDENGVLRDNIDYFADLAQGRQKALANLRDEIDKVYREIFDCSNGDPEGTIKETLQDILTEYQRVLKLKDVAESESESDKWRRCIAEILGMNEASYWGDICIRIRMIKHDKANVSHCLKSLEKAVEEAYTEVFPEDTRDKHWFVHRQAVTDITEALKRERALKETAEEKTIKYKELARENEEKAAKYKVRLGNTERQLRWTEEVSRERLEKYEKLKSELDEMPKLRKKLAEIQDICER